ncbi:hypothetical protein G7046_g219 [Stylonectria norvegica]|nr:hypothetical protein G7046_g219 [Stylonectria norvegica]
MSLRGGLLNLHSRNLNHEHAPIQLEAETMEVKVNEESDRSRCQQNVVAAFVQLLMPSLPAAELGYPQLPTVAAANGAIVSQDTNYHNGTSRERAGPFELYAPLQWIEAALAIALELSGLLSPAVPMHPTALLVFLLATFVTKVRGNATFIEPPAVGPAEDYHDNPTYSIGSIIDFQWDTDEEGLDLLLWQDFPTASDNSSYYVQLLNDSTSTTLNWNASYDGFSTDFSATQFGVFYLSLSQPGSDGTPITLSHYFNISAPDSSDEDVTSTTASLSAAPAPTNTVSITITLYASSTATGSSRSDTTDGDPGLSTGATAGIAVGATIGGIILLAGLGFLAWKRFRKAAEESKEEEQPSSPKNDIKELPGGGMDHELPGRDVVHESPHTGLRRASQEEGFARSPEGLYEAP